MRIYGNDFDKYPNRFVNLMRIYPPCYLKVPAKLKSGIYYLRKSVS